MFTVHRMRAIEQRVEGKGEELERLRAALREGGLGDGGAVQVDDGIQGGSFVTI